MSPGYYPQISPAMAMHFLTSLKFWFILSDTLGVGGSDMKMDMKTGSIQNIE